MTDTTMTTTELPSLNRAQAYAMRDELAELERLERQFRNVRDLDVEYSPSDAIAELAGDMDDDAAMHLATQMKEEAITRLRGACQRKAAMIGFVWEEPAVEDDEIEDDGCGIEGCGCGETAEAERVAVPA